MLCTFDIVSSVVTLVPDLCKQNCYEKPSVPGRFGNEVYIAWRNLVSSNEWPFLSPRPSGAVFALL